MAILTRTDLAILALCFTSAVGIATTMHIFPFIAPLMLSRGVSPDMVSTYSGMAESAISLVSLFAMRLHVWMAGRYRHRPLQVLSMLACGLISAAMGFCREAWQMIALRGLVGFVAMGAVVNVVAVGELVTEETKSQAFSWFAAGAYVGFMGGAALGGYLAEPVGRVPFFGQWAFFERNPYVLPGLAMLACSIVSCIAILLFVPETGGHKKRTTDELSPESAPKATIVSLFKNRSYRNLMIIHFSGRICYFGSLGLMTAAGQLKIDIGGLGMNITKIAHMLFFSQLLVTIVLVFVAERVVKRGSLRQVAMLSASGWILLALFFPVTKLLQSDDSAGVKLTPAFWLAGQALGVVMEPKRNLVILELYPDSADRAMALAVSKQSASAAGAVGAATYGAIFGLSSRAEGGTVERQFVWLWTLAMALVAFVVASTMSVGSTSEHSPRSEAEQDERTALLRTDSD